MKKLWLGLSAPLIALGLVIVLFLIGAISFKDPQNDIPEGRNTPVKTNAPVPPASPSPSPSSSTTQQSATKEHYAWATIAEMPDRIYNTGIEPQDGVMKAFDPVEAKKAISVATETYMDLNNTSMWNSHRPDHNDAQYFSDIVRDRGTDSLKMIVETVVKDEGYLTEPIFLTMPGDGKILVKNEVYTSAFKTPRKSFNPPKVTSVDGERIILTGNVMYEVQVYDEQQNMRSLIVDGKYGMMMLKTDTGEWKVDYLGYEKQYENVQ